MEPLYKITGPNGECLNGGRGQWSLPHDGQPGDWWEIDGLLEPCRNGLHLATAAQLPNWLPDLTRTYFGQSAPDAVVVWPVETDGEVINAGEKMVARKVRLLPRSRPMPDFGAARAKRDRALDRARKAEKRAEKLRAVTIPDQWRAYLERIGSAKLPAAHPGAAYQVKLTEANAAYKAALVPIRAAMARAESVYAATIRKGIMP